MKIAFVGKGGSGKSTVSTQFFAYLLENDRMAAFIDADLNIHAPELIGVQVPEGVHLAKVKNMQEIREFLMGESNKIASTDHFYATTPPSDGVNTVQINAQNPVIKNYFQKYKNGYVAAVGTYDKDAVGISCYHESLSILENILSFTKPSISEWTVVDMVAGIDAFANSLYMQFDVLVLVVEPTREGVKVYKQYRELAASAGILGRLHVVANKVEDDDDLAFIKSHIEAGHLLGHLSLNKEIKKLRQAGEPLPFLSDPIVMARIKNEAELLYRDPTEYLSLLHTLHRRFVKQDYIVNAVGDITSQIDEDFRY